MRTILKKLKSKVGESLVESLAAILIFTMASIVLYSMVTTAGDINSKAKAKDAENQAHLVAVEKGLPSSQNGSGTVTFSMVSGSCATVEIAEVDFDIYGGQNDSLYAYFVKTTPPTGG